MVRNIGLFPGSCLLHACRNLVKLMRAITLLLVADDLVRNFYYPWHSSTAAVVTAVFFNFSKNYQVHTRSTAGSVVFIRRTYTRSRTLFGIT